MDMRMLIVAVFQSYSTHFSIISDNTLSAIQPYVFCWDVRRGYMDMRMLIVAVFQVYSAYVPNN